MTGKFTFAFQPSFNGGRVRRSGEEQGNLRGLGNLRYE